MSSYRYRAVDPRIWNDEKFTAFDPFERLLWLSFLTHPLMTPMGAGVIPIGVLDEVIGNAGSYCFRCGDNCDNHRAEVLLRRFAEPSRQGITEGSRPMILRDGSLFVVTNFLIYNVPSNPNQLCSWLGLCEELPRSGIFKTLRDYLFEDLQGEPKWLFDGLLDPLARQENRGLRAQFWHRIGAKNDGSVIPPRIPSPIPSGDTSTIPSPEGIREGIGQPSPQQDQDQEQEQDQDQDKNLKDVSLERSPKTGDHSKPAVSSDQKKSANRGGTSGKTPSKKIRPATEGTGTAVVTIPLIDGTEAPVTDDVIAEWKKAFPAVDVRNQLDRIRVYFLTNPTKRKTSAGIGRCITLWLGREQDGGGPRQRESRGYAPPSSVLKAPPGKYSGVGIVVGEESTQ